MNAMLLQEAQAEIGQLRADLFDARRAADEHK